MDVFLTTQFQKEFDNYPPDQQDLVLDFVDIVEEYGLSDFDKLEGKLSPSYNTDDPEKYDYAFQNGLWHYHIGIPEYRVTHGKYKTSDWVLHFQWFKNKQSNEIWLLDLYSHYDSQGSFYLPPASYLPNRE